MHIAYGKRRYVPDRCPVCGVDCYGLKPGQWNPIDANGRPMINLLREYFAGWHPYLGEHPTASGLQWWWARCGSCFIDSLRTSPSWTASLPPVRCGMVRIPLEIGRKS